MKIYKITEASDYLGVSINTLKMLANKRRKIRQKICLSNLMEFEKEADGRPAGEHKFFAMLYLGDDGDATVGGVTHGQ